MLQDMSSAKAPQRPLCGYCGTPRFPREIRKIMSDESVTQVLQDILDVTDPSSASHALSELVRIFHDGFIKGRISDWLWRAIASPADLQFEPVLGPCKDTLVELHDPHYVLRYCRMLRAIQANKKMIDLHKQYPAEYNSFRSRRNAAKASHVNFALVLRDFREWLVHLGPQPERNWTVDRIDRNPSKGYKPGNIRWLSKRGQRWNQARVVRSRVQLPNGKWVTIAQLSQMTGVSRNTISQRLRRGWTVTRILEESPSFEDRWWFPPELSFMVKEFKRRENRGASPLGWALQYAEKMVRVCDHADARAKAKAVLDYLQNEWDIVERAELERQQQLREAFLKAGELLLGTPAQAPPSSPATDAADDEDWSSAM